MDKLIFGYAGGFPFSTETLKKMQEAWNVLALLAKGFGDNVILSGVEFSSGGGLNTLSDGIIVLNGELLPFSGGVLPLSGDINVRVKEDIDYITLETGNMVPFRKKRYASISPVGTPLSELIRVKNLAEVVLELNDLSTNKVDKEQGKGLSKNDYTDDDKSEVDKIADKVDKEVGKGLSSNDYTNADKSKVSQITNKVDKITGWGLSQNNFSNYHKSKVDRVSFLEEAVPKLHFKVDANMHISGHKGTLSINETSSSPSSGYLHINSVSEGVVPDDALFLISPGYSVNIYNGEIDIQRTDPIANGFRFIAWW